MEGSWQAQQTILRVARCSDESDIAGLVARFTDDAVVEAGGRTVTGREAIFEFFGGAKTAPPETERTKHVVTNTLFEAEGGALRATSYWQVLGSWGLANWGRYLDRLVQHEGEWRISHRTVVVDGTVARPAAPKPPEDAGAA